MPSKWIEHVKDFAKSKGMTYRDALKSADCKSAYKSGSGGAVAEAPEAKENISMEIKEIAKRGRPKKYATPEEAKKAKSMKTMESNKRKKAEKGGALPTGVFKKIGGKPNPMSDPEFAKKYMEEKAKKEAEGKGLMEAIAKNNEFREKVIEVLPPPMKKMVKEARATKKYLDDNKARITAEWKANGATGGGLIAGYSGEGANGLTHIYPISHDHILQMLKHFEK
jgi:hypothetical protein